MLRTKCDIASTPGTLAWKTILKVFEDHDDVKGGLMTSYFFMKVGKWQVSIPGVFHLDIAQYVQCKLR